MFLAFILSITTLFAQKAGKGEASKPDEYYSCPKHTEVTSHEPGKCSICGTELSISNPCVAEIDVEMATTRGIATPNA